MPKQSIDLDTPFRKGENVLTTRDLRGAPEGTGGRIRLMNGLSDFNGGEPWFRYWVRFEDGTLLGQVSHEDLVRPSQVGEWHERVEAQARAAEDAANAASSSTEASADGAAASGETGIAALIPAALLERSRAAKARLLG